MATARFMKLCLDTSTGGPELGRFWAAASGCEFRRGEDPGDPGDVVGAEEGMGIAICRVPEPRTVKHRVHLDVHTDSVDSLTALGASVLREPDDEISWTVLADPEGGELCAFVRDPADIPAYRIYEMVVDSVDPAAIAGWWAEVFGVPVGSGPRGPWRWLEHVPGLAMQGWVFTPVPEPKTVKNRLHWDLYGEVADFEARGASRLWETPQWTVLADPEGNEFCVFPPRPETPAPALRRLQHV